MIKKTLQTLTCLLAVILMSVDSFACTNILISKGASKDGSVLISYSADSHMLYGELYYTPAGFFPKNSILNVYEWDSGKYMGDISQVMRTYQTVGNMNEHQVMITETTYGGRHELYDSTGVVDYGALIYITLQRAKTAREAIQIIADLVSEYGYGSEGESLSIGDKDEVWILEIIGKGTKMENGVNVRKGAVWAAARVPDGYICAHANQARITKIDFNDSDNWLYSPDVVSFAREMGYFTGEDADFSFCDAYAPLDFGALRGCEARVWSAFNILGDGMIGEKKASDYIDYAMGYNPDNKMPLFIKPAEKVGVEDVADVMRDHYEGTPMDMTQDIGAGGHHTPYRWRPMNFEVDGVEYVNERAIATQQTGFWIICQGRNWLPDEIGGILWFGVDDAATSTVTPIYTSITEVPECVKVGNGDLMTYSPTSLFWLTNRVAQFAYLLYDRVAPEVLATAHKHEMKCLEEVAQVDAKVLDILQKGKSSEASVKATRKYLTDYTLRTTQNLFDTWKELDAYLLVKYMDGNIKHQNEDGTFQNNGYSKAIPAYPSQPGYSDVWKRAVRDDHGDVIKVKKAPKGFWGKVKALFQ